MLLYASFDFLNAHIYIYIYTSISLVFSETQCTLYYTFKNPKEGLRPLPECQRGPLGKNGRARLFGGRLRGRGSLRDTRRASAGRSGWEQEGAAGAARGNN